MKRIAAIGLLILLLYNTFGLTVAILFFDDNHKSASVAQASDDYRLLKVYMPTLPYTEQWEKEEDLDGLLRANGQFYNATHILHANDTLYVTMKSNQPARDQFFALVNMMQSMADSDQDSPDNTRGKVISLLSNFLKHYLQNQDHVLIHPQPAQHIPVTMTYQATSQMRASYFLRLHTPPPEASPVL